MVFWSVLGCVLLIAAIVVIVRMQGAALGPYSTRLLGIAMVCAGYYGALGWLRFGQTSGRLLHWRFLLYLVPAVVALGTLYCIWRVVQNWRAEVHGLVKTLLKLILVLVLGALAWLCFTR